MACVRGSVSLLVAHFEFVEGSERSFAFSAALLSDWQSPDFIDFFLHCSLSKYPTADLKDLHHRSTSAATHGFFSNGRPGHFVFGRRGRGRYDRLCEWKMIGRTQSKASAALFPARFPSLTQRKYCTLTGSH